MLQPILFSLIVAGSPFSMCGVGCPCVVPEGVDWRAASAMVPLARRDAYAIFRGQVTRADTVARDTSSLSPDSPQSPQRIVRTTTVRYTFAVERSWKGPRDAELVVMSYNVDTSCGREYATGLSYLVYADRDRRSAGENELSTYSCSRVRVGAEADEDGKILGAGQTPR